MKLAYGCNPFDKMPLCTSLPEHNPRYWNLVESLDTTGHSHELLARRVKNNVDSHGMLYTPVVDLQEFGDVNGLVSTYNRRLYQTHKVQRLLMQDKGHVFICGYENDTVSIVDKLQKYASSGIDGYTQAVERWLEETYRGIDDSAKKDVLSCYSASRASP